MAEFEIECPHCGEKLTVQSEWNGMEAECPSCKKFLLDFEIPANELPEETQIKFCLNDKEILQKCL